MASAKSQRKLSFAKPAYSNMLQVQALIELLSEKGLLTKAEVLDRVKKLQAQAAKKPM